VTQYPPNLGIQGIKQHTAGGEPVPDFIFQLVIGGRMPSAHCSNSRGKLVYGARTQAEPRPPVS
jgi:hypothetical protein